MSESTPVNRARAAARQAIASWMRQLLADLFPQTPLTDICVFAIASEDPTVPFVMGDQSSAEIEERLRVLVEQARQETAALASKSVDALADVRTPVLWNPWIGSTHCKRIPTGDGQVDAFGWFLRAPEVCLGLSLGEWETPEFSPSAKSIVSQVMDVFAQRVCRAGLRPKSFLNAQDGIREALLAEAVEGSTEQAVVECVIRTDMMSFAREQRWLEVRRVVGAFREATLMTMEKHSVSGGMIVVWSDPALESALGAARVFHRFREPVSVLGVSQRTLLKLLSATDGQRTFLLAKEDQILGIVESYDVCWFSDSPARYEDLPKTKEEWDLQLVRSLTGAPLFLRLLGRGRGGIYGGSRKIVGVRDGRYCLESFKAPYHSARHALRTIGCAWDLVKLIEAAMGCLRSAGKGGLFIALAGADDGAQLCAKAGIPIASSTTSRFNSSVSCSLEGVDAGGLAKMASLDGAVCFTSNGELRWLGAILAPPPAEQHESFDYGARHNTAIRISCSLPDSAVVTVSEDGFIKAYRRGRTEFPDFPLLAPDEEAHVAQYEAIWGRPTQAPTEGTETPEDA